MCLTQTTTNQFLNQEYNTSHLLIGISSTATRRKSGRRGSR